MRISAASQRCTIIARVGKRTDAASSIDVFIAMKKNLGRSYARIVFQMLEKSTLQSENKAKFWTPWDVIPQKHTKPNRK